MRLSSLAHAASSMGLLERKTAPASAPAAPAPETKQRLSLAFEFKEANATERTFEGYLATWDLDLGRDVIHKGAFARTLEHFKRGTKKIPLLDSHNYFSIFSALGLLVDAREDEKGLWTKWRVVDGEDGDKVLARIQSGVVGKMSIGYVAIRYDYGTITVDGGKELSVRNLYEVKLEEGSLVLFPMNEAADVDATSVKLLDAFSHLTPDQKTQLRALLEETPAAPAPEPVQETPKGLAPDAPERLAMDELLRDITLRSLATG